MRAAGPEDLRGCKCNLCCAACDVAALPGLGPLTARTAPVLSDTAVWDHELRWPLSGRHKQALHSVLVLISHFKTELFGFGSQRNLLHCSLRAVHEALFALGAAELNANALCALTLCTAERWAGELGTGALIQKALVHSVLVHCVLLHCVLVHCVLVHCVMVYYALVHCVLVNYMLVHYVLVLCVLVHCVLVH